MIVCDKSPKHGCYQLYVAMQRPEQRLLISAKYDTTQRRFSVWKNTNVFKQMRKNPHSSGMFASSARGFLAFEVHCNKTDWMLKLFTTSNGEKVLWINAPLLWEKTYNVPLCLHNLYFRLQKSLNTGWVAENLHRRLTVFIIPTWLSEILNCDWSILSQIF